MSPFMLNPKPVPSLDLSYKSTALSVPFIDTVIYEVSPAIGSKRLLPNKTSSEYSELIAMLSSYSTPINDGESAEAMPVKTPGVFSMFEIKAQSHPPLLGRGGARC